jgi:hypothetical protein
MVKAGGGSGSGSAQHVKSSTSGREAVARRMRSNASATRTSYRWLLPGRLHAIELERCLPLGLVDGGMP